MNDAEKLLRNWIQNPPKDSVNCEDALRVCEHLEMNIVENNQGHFQATHLLLRGRAQFPYGGFTINCHAFSRQGKAHPKAIKDILKAAKIIVAARQKVQQDDDNTD
jgi:hypothetical protein